MDWSTIIAVAITGICTIIGTYFQNSKTQAVIEYRIKDLSDKVHQHNNLIDRMYSVESRIKLLEEKVK